MWKISQFYISFSGSHSKDNDFLSNWKGSHKKQNKNIPFPGAKTKETGARVNISPSKLWRVSWSEWECFLSGVLRKHSGEGCVCVCGGGYNALGFRQWVPDEIHLDVSLKCGAEQHREVTCPTPCVGRWCLTLSFFALCPVALCTSSDGASTATPGKPSHPWIEPSLKKVALIFSPSFPSCNYIPVLSALSLPVTPSNAFPSSVCLHPCSGRVFDPRSFLLSLSFAYSCLVLQEPL